MFDWLRPTAETVAADTHLNLLIVRADDVSVIAPFKLVSWGAARNDGNVVRTFEHVRTHARSILVEVPPLVADNMHAQPGVIQVPVVIPEHH
jgi:hypothetical protein